MKKRYLSKRKLALYMAIIMVFSMIAVNPYALITQRNGLSEAVAADLGWSDPNNNYYLDNSGGTPLNNTLTVAYNTSWADVLATPLPVNGYLIATADINLSTTSGTSLAMITSGSSLMVTFDWSQGTSPAYQPTVDGNYYASAIIRVAENTYGGMDEFLDVDTHPSYAYNVTIRVNPDNTIIIPDPVTGVTLIAPTEVLGLYEGTPEVAAGAVVVSLGRTLTGTPGANAVTTYSLINEAAYPHNDLFYIDGNAVKVSAPLLEGNYTLCVQASYSDDTPISNLLSTPVVITISVTAATDPDSNIRLEITPHVSQNLRQGADNTKPEALAVKLSGTAWHTEGVINSEFSYILVSGDGDTDNFRFKMHDTRYDEIIIGNEALKTGVYSLLVQMNFAYTRSDGIERVKTATKIIPISVLSEIIDDIQVLIDKLDEAESGDVFEISGNLTLDEPATIKPGVTLVIGDNASLTVEGSGKLTVDNGSLEIDGILNVNTDAGLAVNGGGHVTVGENGDLRYKGSSVMPETPSLGLGLDASGYDRLISLEINPGVLSPLFSVNHYHYDVKLPFPQTITASTVFMLDGVAAFGGINIAKIITRDFAPPMGLQTYIIDFKLKGNITYFIAVTLYEGQTIAASVGEKDVIGVRGVPLFPQDITINLFNSLFVPIEIGSSASSWFKNLPAGLTAVVKSQDPQRNALTITISGTPTVVTNEMINVSIKSQWIQNRENTAEDILANIQQYAKFIITAPPSTGGGSNGSHDLGGSGNNTNVARPETSNNNRPSGATFLVRGAKAGSTVVIEAGKTFNISAETFRALKGKDVDLVLNMDNYTWTINGLTVGDITSNRSINLRVQTVRDSGLSHLAGGNDVAIIRLGNRGSFPFEADLTWDVGTDYSGATLYLYAYNGATNELEYVTAGDVSSAGYVSLDMGSAQASRYVISTQDPGTGIADSIPLAGAAYNPNDFTGAAYNPSDFTSAPSNLPLYLNINSAPNSVGARPFIMRQVGDGYRIGLISLRTFSDFIGAQPAWDANTSTATITGANTNGSMTTVTLVSGQNTITVNGQTYDIGQFAGADNLSGQCTAINENGTIYLPLQAVAKAFGRQLEWDAVNATAKIHK